MKRKLLAALVMMVCTLPIVALAGTTQGTAAASTAVQTPSAPAPKAQPAQKDTAAGEAAKAPAVDDITVKLNIPLFSPQFAKVPLATVNDEKITVEELTKAIGQVHENMAEGKTVHKQKYGELLKRLVNSQLIIQEGRNMELDKLEQVKSAVDDYARDLRREMLLKSKVKEVKASAKDVEKSYQERIRQWRLKSLLFAKHEAATEFEKSLKPGQSFDTLFDAAIKEGKATEGVKQDLFIGRDDMHPVMFQALEKMKVGEISKVAQLVNGFLIFRVEEMRTKENPAVREQVEQELASKAKVKALEAFQDELIKKYCTQKQKLIDKLDFEAKKPGMEALLKDKRVIVEIKGEKPLTVADFADSIRAKFYHGVDRAATGKKVNKTKKDVLREMLATRLFEKEAKVRGIDATEEYLAKVKNYTNSLVFGTFVDKVVRPEITVSRDELQAYYTEHAKEYTTLESYKLDAIAFDTVQKAEDAVEKLRKGMEFKWYKANADGRVPVGNQYYYLFLGEPVNRPDLPETLQKALNGAATGDYRVFVDGKQGYAVSLIEVVPARTKTFAEVEELVKQGAFFKKLNDGVESWAQKLRSASEVKTYADFAQ